MFKIWCRKYDQRQIYAPKMKFKWRPSSSIYFRWLFLTYMFLHHHFQYRTKYRANISIHDWIIITFWNSRWRPSAILDFRKPDFWAMGPLEQLIFHHCTKFGEKMLIDHADIMAQNQNPRWRPSAILELLHHHIGPPTKSFHRATSACQILC